MKPPLEFPKSWKRKLYQARKKTDFRFDPFPSLIAEEWLTQLSRPELVCLIYICRRTWGFRKEWDAISWDQFVSGVVDRSGKHVDCGTGLSLSTARRTISLLESRGLIEVDHRNTRANLFRLTIRRVSIAVNTQPNRVSVPGCS